MTFHLIRAATIILFVLLLFKSRAAADDASDLKAKVDAAMAAVTSYKLLIEYPKNGTIYQTITTMPSAKKIKVEYTILGLQVEAYSIDGRLYQHVNGGAWQNGASVLTQAVIALLWPRNGKITLLKDQSESNVTVGAFSVEQPSNDAASKAVVTSCTYDKQTLLVRRCGRADITFVFQNYNDPQNAIELPAAAQAATPPPAAGPG